MKKLFAFVFKLRSYLFNSSWIMLERVLTLAVTFAVTLVVARYLGPAQFGVLAYAISLTALFGIAGHAGLGGLVMRELVRHPNEANEVMGTSFAMKAAGYLLGLVLLLIFTFSTERVGVGVDSDGFWVLLILSFTLLFKPFEVIDFWFASHLQAKYTTFAKVAAMSVAGAVKVALVVGGAQLVLFAAANVLQVALIALLLVFFYRRRTQLNLRAWHASMQRARALFSEGWMIFLGSIFAVVYLKTDQVMLKWMVGNEEVGVYAVAAVLSEAWYFVPAAIVTSFFPKLIRMREEGDNRYSRSMQQLYDVLLLIALTIAVLVSLLALPVISLLFGSEYIAAASILTIHIWAGVFIFMRAAFSKWILIEKLVIFSLVTQGLGAVINVAFNLYLIPRFGGEGAAYATLASYAVASYFSLAVHAKTRPAFWMMSKALLAPVRLPLQLLRARG